MLTLRNTPMWLLLFWRRVLGRTGLMPHMLWCVDIEVWNRNVKEFECPEDSDAWPVAKIRGWQ